MPIDLKNLQKLETTSPSKVLNGIGESERVVVLVKLREGAKKPSYVSARSQISSQIFSAEMPAIDLPRLEAEPGVESVSLSQRLPLIK